MKRLLLTATICFAFCLSVFSQEEKADTLAIPNVYTPEYLDTVDIKKKFVINDYSMIGVEYGVSMSLGHFNPNYYTTMLFQPIYAGVTFTHYQRMYGRHPYFGYEMGVFYGKQGYCFEQRDKHTIEGANQAVMSLIEVPVWMAMHVDTQFIKFMLNLGPYAGYRFGIHRTNTYDPSAVITYQDAFAPTDRRFDYGINGGVGVGFVVAPVELHVNLRTRFSLSEFHNPTAYIDPEDSSAKWWYSYPWDFTLSVALKFHLSKRTGRSEAELRKEARRRVDESNSINVK